MSRLIKNIVYNLIGQGLLLVLGFVAVKYIFSQLGEDALGIIYFTALTNTVLCAVLQMGISTTTVREVSAHFELEPEYIYDLIRTASLFYWGAYALFGLAIYFFAPLLVENWINLKTMDAATAIYVLRILGIASLVVLPKSLYVSLCRGLQRMEFNNFIDVVTGGLQQFGTILILVSGGNLFHVVYWFAACYVIRIVIYIVLTAHFFSWLSLVPGYSIDVVKRNLTFASKTMFISILSAIHTQADKIIISKVLPIGAVGYYGVAYSNVSRASLLTQAVSQAAFPSFSVLSGINDRNKLLKQYNKLHDLLCFGIVPLFAVIPFAFLPLFSYIFNESIARSLFLPIILLCVGFYMNGTLSMPYIFSLSVGKPEITARAKLYAVIILVPITLLLIDSFGLSGAALSYVFNQIFSYSYGMPRICSECLELSVWKWYRHVLKIFVLVGLTYGLAWIILLQVGTYSILLLALAYMIASVAFLSGSFFMISEELRQTLFVHFQLLKTKIVSFAS